MNQEKVFEATKKAAERPLEFTHSVVEQSKKLRHPSPKAAKIGTAIGSSIGAGFLVAGTIQILAGKPAWAAGSLSAGVITIASNLIAQKRSKDRPEKK